VHLKAGERQTVTFPLNGAAVGALQRADEVDHQPGKFQVWIAPDSGARRA